MHRDTIIGLVGVGILVAAMVGVFTYEQSQAADVAGAGSLQLQTVAGPGVTGTVDLGGELVQIVNITQANLQNVTFTLSWTATQGSDTLRLRVAPSQATGLETGAESEAENDGSIELTLPVANPATGGTLGVGEWEVTVIFESADAGAPGGIPVPSQVPLADQTVDVDVATDLQAYVPVEADDS